MKKKGQVTFFIIAGLVILLLIGVFVTMIDSDMFSAFLGPPDEIKPIVVYTDSCIESVAEQGAFEMKMQGGYINIPEELEITDSLLDIGFKVPYWFYDGRDYMPSILQLEEQLENYIDDNLAVCLDSYEVFETQYEIKKGEPSSSVEISEESIFVETIMPLEIKKIGHERVFNYDTFAVDFYDKLGRLYYLARDIMRHENIDNFLEFYTDEMIAASDYLPFEGMDISCSPNIYFEHELKEYTQTLIMHNLNFLQFLNTDYEETGMPYYDNLYKVDFTNRNYGEMNVDVMYNPSWDMHFEVVPSDSGVVEPFTYEAYNFLQTCLQVYHHRYNINYPVLITITDTEDSGESFNFATPVILKRNKPDRHGSVEGWETEIRDIDDSLGYCWESDEITFYDLAPDGSITTRPGELNRRQHKLNVYVQDSLYGYPHGILEGVNISYQCVEARCHIGTTGYGDDDGYLRHLQVSPHLSAGFPECVNGVIVAEKDGYHTAFEHVTVGDETDGSQVTVDIHKLSKFNYTVRVVEDTGGIIRERDVADDESVFINLRNSDERFEKTLVYPVDENERGHFTDLELLRGVFEYELDIKLTWENSLVGGTNLNWTPDVNKLLNNDEVVFYVYRTSPAVPPSSAEEIYELYEYSLNESVDYPPRLR